MTANSARIWIVKASLLATGLLFLFTIIAPAVGYPLTYEQVPRLAEILLPVFLGYLGSASQFLFRQPAAAVRLSGQLRKHLASLLVRGPIYIFGMVAVAALAAFGMTNRSSAVAGTGMSIDQLSAILAAALGLLAVTTNVAAGYLFAVADER